MIVRVNDVNEFIIDEIGMDNDTPEWSHLVNGCDAGGYRDYVEGKPVYCGSCLYLQAYKYVRDHGRMVPVPIGIPVRYEIEMLSGGGRRVMLYTIVGGCEFSTPLGQAMRFSWSQVPTTKVR